MNQFAVYELFNEAIFLIFTLASPILLMGMSVGIMVSVVQTATSIQEQSLTFIPKLMVTALAIMWLSPWMFSQLMEFAIKLLGRLESFAR